MKAIPITVEATLLADGQTLQLEKRLTLPPGRVTVSVQPIATKSGQTMIEVLDRIHADQQTRGRQPMTDEEMAEEIARMRREDEDYEERWREIWTQTGGKDETTGES